MVYFLMDKDGGIEQSKIYTVFFLQFFNKSENLRLINLNIYTIFKLKKL